MKLKSIIIPFILIFTFQSINCLFAQNFQKNNLNYEGWNLLLKNNVSSSGFVNYAGFKKEEKKLDLFLKQISQGVPNPNWTENEQLAFWINAYNAYTIKLILNYQNKNIKSIKDIATLVSIPFVNSPWDIEFITIGDEKYDLNDLEHNMIRKKFNEPRIHAALVCAAKSCPKLRNEAYIGSKLENQLNQQMSDFINNPAKNKIEKNKMALSKIFQWYGSDFTKIKPIYEWINQYSTVKVNSKTPISYLNYDWSLNGSF